MRTFASSLLRWLITPAYGSRQVHFRLKEAEFPAASQSVSNLFAWTVSDSRAADGASIDALCPFNNWLKLKDQHELLFNREAFSPFAWRDAPQGQPTLSGSAGESETAKKDILAAGGRIFRRRHRHKESRKARPQRYAAIAAVTKT